MEVDVPDKSVRHDTTYSRPPVPTLFAASFLASKADSTPPPNFAVCRFAPPLAMCGANSEEVALEGCKVITDGRTIRKPV